jgi:pyruvate dehydrogenase E2 component (dihydrolipoamide acetyltransferase)
VAGEKGVNLEQVEKLNPSVPRIVVADVNAHVAKMMMAGGAAAATTATTAPTATTATTTTAPSGGASGSVSVSAAFTDTTVSGIRKTIAARLLESKTTIPHYYLTVECKLDEMLAVRQKLNRELEERKAGVKLSVNDFVIKAASLACLKVPEANSSWQGTFIRTHHVVDMNVAVSTPNGLVAPVISGTHARGLVDISKAVREVAQKAKDGKLMPADLASGTFTISNLGMFGVDSFSAIINPPQSCILAVGQARRKLVVAEDGESEGTDGTKTATVMNVTLSCDHRTVDGAVGAQWLQQFKKFIEDPLQMIL